MAQGVCVPSEGCPCVGGGEGKNIYMVLTVHGIREIDVDFRICSRVLEIDVNLKSMQKIREKQVKIRENQAILTYFSVFIYKPYSQDK